ncbi:hypothetical protein BJF85_05185 [Saccharomonospora sp. CUA-673]|nr:hypothetical protein BJF85_05185 [Saccharomonospora sp. CUA-673]
MRTTGLRRLGGTTGRRGHRGDDLRGVAVLVRLLRGRGLRLLRLPLLLPLLRRLLLALLGLALGRLLGLRILRRLSGRGRRLGARGVLAVGDGRRQDLVTTDAVVVCGESARRKLFVQLAQLFLPGHAATPCSIRAAECRRPLLRCVRTCSFCTVCRL